MSVSSGWVGYADAEKLIRTLTTRTGVRGGRAWCAWSSLCYYGLKMPVDDQLWSLLDQLFLSQVLASRRWFLDKKLSAMEGVDE